MNSRVRNGDDLVSEILSPHAISVMPPTAWAIIQGVAEQHETTARAIRDGGLDVRAARIDAMRRLAEEQTLSGARRYTHARIASWFGISKQRVGQIVAGA